MFKEVVGKATREFCPENTEFQSLKPNIILWKGRKVPSKSLFEEEAPKIGTQNCSIKWSVREPLHVEFAVNNRELVETEFGKRVFEPTAPLKRTKWRGHSPWTTVWLVLCGLLILTYRAIASLSSFKAFRGYTLPLQGEERETATSWQHLHFLLGSGHENLMGNKQWARSVSAWSSFASPLGSSTSVRSVMDVRAQMLVFPRFRGPARRFWPGTSTRMTLDGTSAGHPARWLSLWAVFFIPDLTPVVDILPSLGYKAPNPQDINCYISLTSVQSECWKGVD